MPFLGSVGRIDQLQLQRIDPTSVEDDGPRTIQNILTGDVEASNLFTSNIAIGNQFDPTHAFELGSNLFMDDVPTEVAGIVLDVKKTARFEKLRASSRIAVENENPTHALDVGVDKFFIDTASAAKNLAVLNGRMRAQSFLATSVPVAQIDDVDPLNFITTSNLQINDTAEDIINVAGNVICEKITATQGLSFGSNIELADTSANVLVLSGNLVAGKQNEVQSHRIYGNLYVDGNVIIQDLSQYNQAENLTVSNAIIEVGSGITSATGDTAIVFHQYNTSNVIVGYLHGTAYGDGSELAVGRTNNGPSAVDMEIVPLPAGAVNVHVYGSLWASNVGVGGNTNPQHDFALGSNLRMNDEGSNVLHVASNTYSGNVSVGEILSIGSNVRVTDILVDAECNANFTNVSTRGIAIANATPNHATHALSIGDSVFARRSDANTFVVTGNTVSSNLIVDTGLSVGRAHADEALHVDGNIRIGGEQGQEEAGEKFIKSASGLVVHANDAGTDDLHSALVLKAGSGAKSVVEIRGAYTNADEQAVVVKTLDVEALRVSNQQNVGISNTNPSERLTIDGTCFVRGSGAVQVGEEFTNGKHSIRARTDVANGRTYLESRVSPNEGLSVGVTAGATMGDPKVTILESGRVGVNSSQPQSTLQVSGGSLFVGANVANDNGFNHGSIPLLVTNQTTSAPTTPSPVFALARQGAGTNYGSKVQFNMAQSTSGANSSTRLDIDLADTSYDAVNCMTLRSDGKTGFGAQVPTARVHARADGSRNPTHNGLLVFNPTTVGVEDAIATTQVRQGSGDAFVSTSVWDGTTNYTGWSFGSDQRSSADVNFRITNNVFSVSNILTTALFISGADSNVGIGTDSTPAKLTVSGSVRVGDKLQFKGTTASGTDSDDKIFFQEREIGNTGRTELLVYKGNDADTSSDAVDRIRTVSGEHTWQVYDRGTDPSSLGGVSESEQAQIVQNADIAGLFASKPVMRMTRKRQIFLNTEEANENQADTETSMYSTGHIQLHPGSKLMTAYFSLMSDVQSQGASPPATASGDNQFDLHPNFDLMITHGTNERVRVKNDGLVGIGTNAPSTKLEVYDASTSDIDLLTLRSPSATTLGTTTNVGLKILTETGWGGYARAFRTRANGTDPSGLILGSIGDTTERDVVTITGDARVGINTSAPDDGLHVYDTNVRVSSTSSNAVVTFETTVGTANIQCGSNGDLFLNPLSVADDTSNVVIKGNLDVSSNISFGGSIEFAENAGLGIGIPSPQTLLHVNGGTIMTSDHVAEKHYSHTFRLGAASDADGEARDVFLRFLNGSFMAEIKALLRDTSNGNYLSCLALEVAGGHSNPNTTPTFNIAVGSSRIYGSASNPFPWDHRIVLTPTTIKIYPKDNSASRTYDYDVHVKVYSSRSGGLHKIQHDEQSIKDLVVFNY